MMFIIISITHVRTYLNAGPARASNAKAYIFRRAAVQGARGAA